MMDGGAEEYYQHHYHLKAYRMIDPAMPKKTSPAGRLLI
jgi:hypothetical protein